ncbi:MAG: class I SAM-dependent methyltransferase [Ignavibacteriaceae bacterium]
MDTKKAYNIWSAQYDTNDNKTRDLEAKALRITLENFKFNNCLEIGCGTGKNTEWLITKSRNITAIDLSEEMLARAKEKIKTINVKFIRADITKDWNFTKDRYDLISFSLVLEHIENLERIFKEAAMVINPGGYIYIGELHPFKQYLGTKARFETEKGTEVLTCFNHNISDFTRSAKKYGFEIIDINEFFDNDDRTGIPRIIAFVLRKL